jgi:hypothetical protein
MKTKKEFEKFFRREVLPYIKEQEQKYGPGIDRPWRRKEWVNTIDVLIRDGELPEHASEWSCPW